MREFLNSMLLVGGLSFLLLAASPVCGQPESGEIIVNKKPLTDFAASVRQLDEGKRVDWTKPFLVEIEGVIAKDGKLTQAKINKTAGDAELIKVAQQGIAALGESRWLGYLSSQRVEKIKFIAAQDSENFSLTIVSELATIERANTVSSGLNGLIQAALMADKMNYKKLGDDEKILLKSARVTTAEKTVNISFVLPAIEFREMARRRI